MVYVITVHLYTKPDEESIAKVAAKLKEASLVYSRDRETISWFVSQDIADKRAFTIIERYEQESSQKYHLDNPYWQTFDPFVKPLLAKPMDLRRSVELPTGSSQPATAPPSGAEAKNAQDESVIADEFKVERDPELWKKVAKHQDYRVAQGNY